MVRNSVLLLIGSLLFLAVPLDANAQRRRSWRHSHGDYRGHSFRRHVPQRAYHRRRTQPRPTYFQFPQGYGASCNSQTHDRGWARHREPSYRPPVIGDYRWSGQPATRVLKPAVRATQPVRPTVDPLVQGLNALGKGRYFAARRNLGKAYARSGSRQALLALLLARLAGGDARGAGMMARIAISSSGARPVRLNWDPVAQLAGPETFDSLLKRLEQAAGDSGDLHFLAGLLRFQAEQLRQARASFRRALALDDRDAQARAFEAKIQHGVSVAYSRKDWRRLNDIIGAEKVKDLRAALAHQAGLNRKLQAANQALAQLSQGRRESRLAQVRLLVALRSSLDKRKIEPPDYARQRDLLTTSWRIQQAQFEAKQQQLQRAIQRNRAALIELAQRIQQTLTS